MKKLVVMMALLLVGACTVDSDSVRSIAKDPPPDAGPEADAEEYYPIDAVVADAPVDAAPECCPDLTPKESCRLMLLALEAQGEACSSAPGMLACPSCDDAVGVDPDTCKVLSCMAGLTKPTCGDPAYVDDCASVIIMSCP